MIQIIGEEFRGMGIIRQCRMRMFHWLEEKNYAKPRAAFIALLSLLFIFLNGNAVVLGTNLEPFEKIKIDEESGKVPLKFVSFCVIDGVYYLIPDMEAGDIKIYEKNGTVLKWIDQIGQKGYNSTNLVKPTYCCYDKYESKFAVLDHGFRKIFIYDRMGLIDFKQVGEVSCISGGSAIQLSNNKLYIAGYIADQYNNHYYLYNIDMNDGKTTFLLPAYTMFGFKSNREFEIEIKKSVDIPAIGINGWFDIYGYNAYFIWEGNLSVVRVNVESGTVDPRFFGERPPHYIKPYSTDKLIEGQRKRNIDTIKSERAKMSYTRNIFASEKSKLLLVIYAGPVNNNQEGNFRLQLYTLGGDFIKEISIRLDPDSKIWFDKEKDILYALSGESKTVLKYQVY